MSKPYVYVASSWRNPLQPEVVAAVIAAGFDAYDFKNPAPGDHGFGWKQTGIDPADGLDAAKMRQMLASDAAVRGFALDLGGCASADACLLARWTEPARGYQIDDRDSRARYINSILADLYAVLQ